MGESVPKVNKPNLLILSLGSSLAEKRDWPRIQGKQF